MVANIYYIRAVLIKPCHQIMVSTQVWDDEMGVQQYTLVTTSTKIVAASITRQSSLGMYGLFVL
jgi:hypothetical protein